MLVYYKNRRINYAYTNHLYPYDFLYNQLYTSDLSKFVYDLI
nr:MAG TPA: hypothetical protein [Caudoviricetes sp.]